MRSATAAASTPIKSGRLVPVDRRAPRVDRDQGERGARRRDRERREDRPGRTGQGPCVVPVTLRGITLTSAARNSAANAIGRSTPGRPISNDASSHSLANSWTAHADRADGEEHAEVRDVRPREREGAVGRDTRGDDQRELRGRGGARRVRARSGPKVQEQHRADRRAQQGHVGRDLAAVLARHVFAELDRHGDQEQHGHPEEADVIQAEPGGLGPGRVGHQERAADDPDGRDPQTERAGAPPRVLMPAPQQDHDRRQQAGARDDREPDLVGPAGAARDRVRESHAAARDEQDEGREPWSPALCLRGHRSSVHDDAGGLAPPSPDRGQPVDRP